MTIQQRALRVGNFLAALVIIAGSAALADDWTQSGADLSNSRHQAKEKTLGPGNVGDLAVKWSISTDGDVSSTPAIQGGAVYFSDWGGSVWRVKAKTGEVVWKASLGATTGLPFDFSRNTPTVAGDLVILGNQAGRYGQLGAKLVALNKETGATEWVTQLDTQPSSIVTSSPTVDQGVAYVGVASYEEGFAAFVPGYPCCFFRGSVVAVDIATGNIIWKAYMSPGGVGPGDYSGNAVWGSSPAIDRKRGLVYVATGNNYTAPVDYHECIESAANPADQAACNVDNNYFDSIVALDTRTGAVKWASRVLPYDTWTVSCAPELAGGIPLPPGYENNCGYGVYEGGPDFDFGQGPIVFTAGGRDLVGAGQKSGVYWAVDADNGEVVWSTRTGPGGLAGGHQWGSASDGERIYTSNANSLGAFLPPWVLPDGSTTNGGIFSALDAATGEVLWQTANPEPGPFPPFQDVPAGSPASVANGVVYVCSAGLIFIPGYPNPGTMYAFDAATGEKLWEFASGGSCGGGASIQDGAVYWGSGYSSIGGTPNNKLYAFSLNGE